MEVTLEEVAVGLDDGEEQDREPPHDEEVGKARNGPLEQLLLTGDFDDFGFDLLREALEATRGWLASANELRKPEKALSGNSKTGDGDAESKNDPNEHNASVSLSARQQVTSRCLLLLEVL